MSPHDLTLLALGGGIGTYLAFITIVVTSAWNEIRPQTSAVQAARNTES